MALPPLRDTFAWVVSRVEPLGLLSTRLSGHLVNGRLAVIFRKAIFDGDVLPLDIAGLAKASTECCNHKVRLTE